MIDAGDFQGSRLARMIGLVLIRLRPETSEDLFRSLYQDLYPQVQWKGGNALAELLRCPFQMLLSLIETPEPDLAHLFKHSLTQEVVYQHLLFSQAT